MAKEYGRAAATGIAGATGLEAGKTYIVTTAGSEDNTAGGGDVKNILIDRCGKSKLTRGDGTKQLQMMEQLLWLWRCFELVGNRGCCSYC